MNQLTDEEIASALHRAVPEPPEHPARLATVRRRARQRRQLQVCAGSLATIAVVAAGALVAGGIGESSRQTVGVLTPAHTLAELHQRPLHLPTVAAGIPCPISPSHTFPAGGGFTGAYVAVGDGPFTLTMSGKIPVNFNPQPPDSYAGTGWPGMKVIWRVSADYSGPLLLRGARIDGTGALRFDHYLGAIDSQSAVDGSPANGTAYPDLAYDTTSNVSTVTTYPSAIRVQSPGCYGLQVDGTNFSEVITFQVTSQAG
jgi:hypothetical protein